MKDELSAGKRHFSSFILHPSSFILHPSAKRGGHTQDAAASWLGANLFQTRLLGSLRGDRQPA
jgi:hypothetical protein